MTPQQTKEFIDLCLQFGISKLRVGDPKGGELSLEFFERQQPLALTQEVVPESNTPKSEGKRGADGLTAEEQFDLLGRVIDAVP